MKTSHHSCKKRRWRDRFPSYVAILGLLFGALPMILAGAAAWAGPVERTDPILRGPAPGPCAGALQGAEYVGGTDAYGRPVAVAAVPGEARIHLDSETVYPRVRQGRHGTATEVRVTVHGLHAALGAPTGCALTD